MSTAKRPRTYEIKLKWKNGDLTFEGSKTRLPGFLLFLTAPFVIISKLKEKDKSKKEEQTEEGTEGSKESVQGGR